MTARKKVTKKRGRSPRRSPPEGRKSAAARENVRRPKNWDKRVSYAYLRLQDLSQQKAAEAAGVSERTGWGWENDDSELWEGAKAEARKRWLNDAADAARTAVMKSLKRGNADLGLKVLERLEEAMRPPAVQLKHSGTGPGGAIQLNVIGPGSAPPILPSS